MSEPATKSILTAEAVVEGDIIARSQFVVSGRVQGNVSAQSVEITQGGGIYGSLRAQNAQVNGDVQGDVAIAGLIQIGKTGAVNGNVQYGRIAMEQGGELSATLRNIPPQLGGDLHLIVPRGGAVRITVLDLTAFDPDDSATSLSYSVANATGGFVALERARGSAVASFTQEDLERGHVLFVHDGSAGPTAGFDTQVSDAKGATSGAPRHVTVDVRG